MTLIKSISGIRGTIGGKAGDNFTANDIVACTAAYAQIVKETEGSGKIVVGRDGRITGEIVSGLVINTLLLMGFDVVDLGLSTTPTVEMAVEAAKAKAGIILTASHNPKEWNALKFLNRKGEFISPSTGEKVLEYIENNAIHYAEIDKIGRLTFNHQAIDKHIEEILALAYIDKAKIAKKNFHIVVDCINSTGALSIPPLLDKLGCSYTLINEEITGEFAHNPEPLPEHLTQLSEMLISEKANLGIVVDPDVDRLAFVDEDGKMFGEEYTLVACADYMLSIKKGPTVSNLSSTRALRDVTGKYGMEYFPAKVGEVNVVEKMKLVGAVIGGEGNGGVILPDLHYGRDALAGIALMLALLSERNCSLSELKKSYPNYFISKNKVRLDPSLDPDFIIDQIAAKYDHEQINTEDGLKIDFADSWVQIRKSNTEPILRVYAEGNSAQIADDLANMLIGDIKAIG